MSPCSKDELADIVVGLDSGKASDIPISHLKKTLGGVLLLLDPLFRLFNYFLNNGILPNIFKKASVTPIFKKMGLAVSGQL